MLTHMQPSCPLYWVLLHCFYCLQASTEVHEGQLFAFPSLSWGTLIGSHPSKRQTPEPSCFKIQFLWSCGDPLDSVYVGIKSFSIKHMRCPNSRALVEVKCMIKFWSDSRKWQYTENTMNGSKQEEVQSNLPSKGHGDILSLKVSVN